MLAAAAATWVGLVKSYSRGAWAGAVVGVGVAYLIAKAESGKQKAEIPNAASVLRWAGRRWVELAIISVAIGMLVFWNCRHAEQAVARRAYTVTNANDFSWRNRVAAYEGALQMLADRPWFGFGWNHPERVYDRYYRSARVDEGMAIQLNDYFTLGATLGVPALFCFGVYLWLGLAWRSPIADDKWPMAEGEWLKANCRAGAVVLAVGFWFDGGLFKLATGATFWVLLELGREAGSGAG